MTRPAPSREDTSESAPQSHAPAPVKQPAPKTGAGAATEATAPPGGIALVSGATLLARIAQSGARATLVNAWASWCGPCRAELPMLVALGVNLRQSGVRVVFVSVDEPGAEGAARAFASEHGLAPPLLLAEPPLGAFKLSLNPRWPGMVPATFLFDERAQLRYFWGGPAREEEILPVVEALLAGEPVQGESRFDLAPGRDER
jgi:thiol-disulfide isomerase/thioredoxin